jgi:hypothetical protein
MVGHGIGVGEGSVCQFGNKQRRAPQFLDIFAGLLVGARLATDIRHRSSIK